MRQAVTPETIFSLRSEQQRAHYERNISRMVAWLEKRILAKFKSAEKPIRIYGFIHPLFVQLTVQAQHEIAARLRADGWLLEYPTWRHPLRVMNGTVIVRAGR